MTSASSSAGVIVTGGTGAIGSAVCRLLAAAGHHIAFTYRANEQGRSALAAELAGFGSTVMSRSVDLTDVAATAAFVEDAAEQFGGLGTVIHAAGPHVAQRYISQITPAQFATHVDNEVKAFFNLLSPALGHLRAGRGGSIVAVTTVAIRRFPLRDGLSSGPKAGIEAIVRAVAAEEGRFGVRANCVGPGILGDGMAAELHASGDFTQAAQQQVLATIPLRRFGSALDVAEMVCFLASERAAYVSGQSIDVDGGYGL